MNRRLLLATATAAGLTILPVGAMAQAYPAKPISIIVPFAAGGPTDSLARILGQRMGEALGQPVIVDNVAGAGGTIGVNKAAKASPDGYTVLFAHMGTLAVNIALYKTLPYDSQKDLEPIGLGGTNPMALVVKKDLPVKNFAEFQAWAKANQKKAQYGMAGIGAASHLGGLMLNDMIKVDVLEVPYKGTAPALNDLVSGQFDYMVDQAVNVLPQIQSGNIRALGVSTLKRLPQLPDVPTIDEAGLKGYEVTIWNGFFVPKGTPKDIVTKLNQALVTALSDEKLRVRLTELAVDLPAAKDATPEAMRDQLKASIDKWVPTIKGAGIQPQ